MDRMPLPEPEQPLFSAREADAERRREQSQRRVTPLWPSHRRRNASVRKADPRRVPGPSYDVPSYRRAIARGVDLANCALVRAALEGVLEKAGPGTSSSDLARVLGKLTPRSLLNSEGRVHLDEARLERVIRRRAPMADVAALLEAARAATGRLELVPRWHPHQLRHSCATRLRREQGLEAARVVLGHTSPAVTTHYAEVDAEKARLVMERLG